MTIIMSASTFCNYLILFYLKYVPGNIFIISYATAVPGIIFSITAGSVMLKFGLSHSFSLGFMVMTVSALAIMFIGPDHPSLSPVFIFACKSGIDLCFTLCFIATSLIYPPIIAASCLGFTNIIGKMCTSFAAIAAETTG